MQHNRESASVVVRFLDSFLQEQNIKWMLGMGTLLLLGSSLRLVSIHWGEYTPFWKYGILLAYTATIYLAGQISYFRLGLLRTGTMLMALTVLLIPVTFYALHWVQPAGQFGLSELVQQAGLVLLLGVNLVLSTIASSRIFVHFLRRPQPTFQCSYMALSLAGAAVPGLPPSWSFGNLAVLWLLFAAGTLKVNRHVFWLCEEERRPRIFGFFPLILLGAQFLGLFAVNLASQIDMQWWGLACVLVAIPILLTSDTVARGFQQRTGNLIRPLPSSIVAPLMTGLLLCAAGLCFAMAGLPRPSAIVPTAALASIVLGVVASRTQYPVFTWFSIGAVLLAYQFSPLFFLEFAKAVIHRGAAVVHESRLPYAFYGLTYLPILLLFTSASLLAQRFQKAIFAVPLRQAAIWLASLLLVAAFGHPKALFPVSMTMLGVFAMQAISFADRRLLIPANLALIAAAWGFPAFQSSVLQWSSAPHSPLFYLTITGVLQLTSGRWIDRFSLRFDGENREPNISPRICELFSLVVTVFASTNFVITAITQGGQTPPVFIGLMLGGLLIAHSLLNVDPRLGLTTIVFLNLLFLWNWFSFSFSWESSLLCVVVLLCFQWIAGLCLQRRPAWIVSSTFAGPMKGLSEVFQWGVMLGAILPVLLHVHFKDPVHPSLIWTASGLMAVWCYCAALQKRQKGLVVGGFLIILLLSSAILVQHVGMMLIQEWIPLIWSMASMGQFVVFRIAKNQKSASPTYGVPVASASSLTSLFPTMEILNTAVLVSVLVGSTALLGIPLRLAAGAAIAGLLWKRNDETRLIPRELTLCLANWQILCLLIYWLTGSDNFVHKLTLPQVLSVAFPISLFAALSIVVVEAGLCRSSYQGTNRSGRQILIGQELLLAILCAATMGLPGLSPAMGLNSAQIAMAVITFITLAISQLIRACREQSTTAVWLAEVIGGAAFGYLAGFGVIELSLRTGMSVLLSLSVILWISGRLAARTNRLAILSGPFQLTAYWLPLLVVVLGIVHHGMHSADSWKGLNSLALLLSACFYFCQGMNHFRLRNWVLSLSILNVALVLLWRELEWHDAQFFMIPLGASVLLLTELLWKEIPRQFHDPMRYTGALIILVSPTFEIVGGSWLHLLSLMFLAVSIVLLAIGLRVRTLVYTGTAFLIADLIAMLVRGSLSYPNLLWASGIVLGLGVIALAAYCEHHREILMSRVRLISAELETWK